MRSLGRTSFPAEQIVFLNCLVFIPLSSSGYDIRRSVVGRDLSYLTILRFCDPACICRIDFDQIDSISDCHILQIIRISGIVP